MIFHASIPARHPEHVAGVLAELWGGFVAPFPAFPDSWMAVAGDERGTIIEVYPSDRVLHPGDGDADFQPGDAPPARYSAFHMAVATKLSAEEVIAIGAREGWRAIRCTRGDHFFDVIELWIDNTTLIECLTAEMQADYLAFATPANFRAMAGAGPA
ncbi:hypothetical protein AWB68_07522 [Caballeronia choica]|jgi:hypothetical protein|uniref:Uncharacterized protein n=1 Tax=Caballeronia choica TaxID=326476 RepID=A0A158KWA1_9BURK|nr:hypothetical protein [Caballeronia choica]SAL84993.1 hypothetical protein AWB68_07522 [Caballeronia choica]